MYGKSLNLDVCLPAGQLPETGKPYWVQCKDYRCLGIADKVRKWKNFHTGIELSDVIKVVEPQ
jgi:hypothetical protein